MVRRHGDVASTVHEEVGRGGAEGVVVCGREVVVVGVGGEEQDGREERGE